MNFEEIESNLSSAMNMIETLLDEIDKMREEDD